MIEPLEQEIISHGDKSKIVPIDWFHMLENDINNLKSGTAVDEYTNYGLGKLYNFELPKLDFDIKSIIIVASPSPFFEVTFNYNGKETPLMLPPGCGDWIKKQNHIEKYLNDFLNPLDLHAKITFNMPQKILTVRSGLGIYGKNNVCYIDGMGSFFTIETFYSNIICADSTWHEIKRMDTCETCEICINNCPTKAITNENNIIRAGRCIVRYNEQVGEFPDWIEPTFHNCIVACIKCQYHCPNNKTYIKNYAEPVSFTEDETNDILKGKPIEELCDTTQKKLFAIDAQEYYRNLPRNLKVLFNNTWR